MPASDTSATVSPPLHPLHQLGGALLLVVLVVAHQGRAHAVAVEQRAGAARVLAGDHVGVAQRGEHAQRHVLQVADRRGAHHEAHGAVSVEREQSGAEHGRLVTEVRGHDPHGSRPSVAGRARATTSRAGSSRRSPAATAPPPTTTTSGSSALTTPQSPEPSCRPISARTSRASASPPWASSVTSPPVICPPSARRRPSAERGVARGGALAGHADRVAAHQHLEAAAAGAVARAVRAVVVDHQVAQLAREAVRAAVDLAVEHEPAADARAERDHHGVMGAPAAPWRCSASAAALVSLSTTTGSPRRSLIRSRNGTSSIGRWFDHTDAPLLCVHQRWDPEAHRLDVRAPPRAPPRRSRARCPASRGDPPRATAGAPGGAP